MTVNRFQQLYSNNWAITFEGMQQFMLSILPALKSGSIDNINAFLDNPIKAVVRMPNTVMAHKLDDIDIPENSIVVLYLEGVLLSWETFKLEAMLKMAADNPRIGGVVLWINGPGGMVQHVDVVAQLIADFTKPVATFVAGMMASAHYWIGSAADRIFVASPLCEIGSVGTMTTFVSFRDNYKQMGIDYRNIYAPQSDLKNEEFRKIEEDNNEQPLKDYLTEINNYFIAQVSRYRNIPVDMSAPFFRGKIFTGTVAVANGYADEFGTVEDAILWVYAQAISRVANKIV